MLSKVYLDINNLVLRREKRAILLPKLNLAETISKHTSITATTTTLKSYVKMVYDQGQLGSCTATAFCAAFNIQNAIKKKYIGFFPSALFFYYKERVIEKSINIDAGADVIDGEKYVKDYGICSEQMWPYIISKFAIKPPSTCDIDAIKHKINTYMIIPINSLLLVNIKKFINNNIPVLIAIAVYESFASQNVANTGIIPIPNLAKERLLGGHEMCLIGYDDTKNLFIVQNSWGTNWGDKGFCYLPYSYLTNPQLGIEFTCINL